MNYNPLDVRNDIGALWENFCIVERIKFNQYNRNFINIYFWRTYDQKEIDYIEEANGVLHAFEFKWQNDSKTKIQQEFLATYPESDFTIIDRNNYLNFINGH